MFSLINSLCSFKSSFNIFTNSIYEEHSPINYVIESVARFGKLGLFKRLIVSIPGFIQIFYTIVFNFKPFTEFPFTVITITKHIIDLISIISIKTHFGHAACKFRFTSNIPYFECGVIFISINNCFQKFEEMFYYTAMIKTISKTTYLSVRLSLRANYFSTKSYH